MSFTAVVVYAQHPGKIASFQAIHDYRTQATIGGTCRQFFWEKSYVIICLFSYGSFTPKLNLQPTGFRLTPDWLQTSFRLVNAVGLHW